MAHSIGPKTFPASLRKILGGSENWRASGDAARDRKDWSDAALRYRRHLEKHSEDAAIWVQLGHALKENHNWDEAESAYQTALRLTPDDADLHLQLGHLWKVMGRINEAMESYAAASRLQPTSRAATEIAELRRRDGATPKLVAAQMHTGLMSSPRHQDGAKRLGKTGRVFLPVDDLLVYLHHHRTVSGIQRVQLNFFTYILGLRNSPLDYAFLFSATTRELRTIATGDMSNLIEACGDHRIDHDVIRRLIMLAREQSHAVHLQPFDTCFIAGSFWSPTGNPDLLSQIKDSKARLGIYFYDLIPVTHREYVVSELSAGFSQALIEALSFVDFGFGISDYTTKAVADFVLHANLKSFPISTVRLAHAQLAPAIGADTESEWLEVDARPQDDPFVLCVGTIEGRKNHRYLFDIWKALVAEGIEPPKLVLVGRQGWRVDDLMAQLEATQYLDGRIEVLHDVSDLGLDALYRKSMFTIFPSIVEGWGLPIGESLSHGKLCVASNTTSMPEVGGDLVEYFDPWNLRSGIDVVRRLLNNPMEVAQREAAIRNNFKLRTWADFGAELTHGIATSSQAVIAPHSFVPSLPSGILFKPLAFNLQHPHKFDTTLERQRRLILVAHWGICEDFGAWMAGRTARLAFRSDVTPGAAITVYLHLALITTEIHNELSIDAGDGAALVIALPGHQREITVRVPTRAGLDGVVALTLTIIGPMRSMSEQDDRSLRAGLISLSYAGVNDCVARAEILESLLIGSGAVMH